MTASQEELGPTELFLAGSINPSTAVILIKTFMYESLLLIVLSFPYWMFHEGVSGCEDGKWST
jgi:hypothetical protein